MKREIATKRLVFAMILSKLILQSKRKLRRFLICIIFALRYQAEQAFYLIAKTQRLMNIEFTPVTESDLGLIKEIYDYYILHSTATFHTEEISVNELKDIIPLNHPKYKSFLIFGEGNLCGYCYMAPYKKRQAYDRSAEITVYLKHDCTGMGIGKKVIQKLEEVALENGIKVLLGIITGENIDSIRLFERNGFEKCAHFKGVGEKFGRVLDVVAYQKML